MRAIVILSLLAGACATLPAPADGPETAPAAMRAGEAVMPTGAKRGPGGYASIGPTPPSSLPQTPPPMPTELDVLARQTSMGTPAEQAAAWARVNGDAAFQQEFERLRDVLARHEPGNFITVRLVRDPGVMGEFVFARDGAATLAKYTADPQFRAVTTGVDPVGFTQLEQLWLTRTREDKAPITIIGSNAAAGTIELTVGIEEEEFRRLARRKGWDIADPRLEWVFPQPRPPGFADPALAALVRAFPRENAAAGIRLLARGTGRVVLQDGCFRLADTRGRPGPKLVMFARGSQLALDEDGYLVIRTPDEERQYRVGEPGSWGGPNGVDEGSEDVRALRRACGRDEVVNIAAPESEVLSAAPYPLWVLDYAYTKDIPYAAAWTRVIACMNRQMAGGRQPLAARDRCIKQYNGWEYREAELPPPPGS